MMVIWYACRGIKGGQELWLKFARKAAAQVAAKSRDLLLLLHLLVAATYVASGPLPSPLHMVARSILKDNANSIIFWLVGVLSVGRSRWTNGVPTVVITRPTP